MTMKGERILGMSPVERTDVDGNSHVLKCRFYVEKKDQRNPIACEDSGRIGQKASHAYRHDLPLSEQKDLRIDKHKYTSADQEGFRRIKAVHAKDGYSANVYPETTIWAEYENPIDDKLLKRTGLRQIWGSHEADRMIEDFYIDNTLEIPWEKRAKRVGRTRSERGRRSGYENRRRTRSTSPIDSDLDNDSEASDATWEPVVAHQISAVDQRMTKLEEMFRGLMTRLDDRRGSRG